MFDEYFLWVLDFMCKKVEKYFHSRNEECSFTLLKRAENLITQQKDKKSQFDDRSQRNVPFAIGTKNKPSFQYCPLDFGLNVYAQSGSGKMRPWSPFRESVKPNFLPRKSLEQKLSNNMKTCIQNTRSKKTTPTSL